MKTEIDDKWINTDDVTEYLGVKVTTIRKWINKNNRIPVHKIERL